MSGSGETYDVFGSRDPNAVTLLVAGVIYGGWQSVRITRGIELMPSSFDVAMTDSYPGQVGNALLLPGQDVVVKIGSHPVITGYIDAHSIEVTAESHTVRITGRGRCQDLVDCAAGFNKEGLSTGQIGGVHVTQLVEQLATPFAITVTDLMTDDPGLLIPRANIVFGETVFEIIDRSARYAARLVYEDQTGNLVLARAGTELHQVGMVQGRNVQAMSCSYSTAQRYSHYYASLVGENLYTQTGDAVFLSKPILDPTIRFRPMVTVSAELQGDTGKTIADLRAQWEMARRIGRSQAVTVTVDDWRDPGDRVLWTPNRRAPVQLPALKLDVVWTISEVTYLRGLDGTTAEVQLMPPDAFLPMPVALQQFDWQVDQALRQTGGAATPAAAAP